MNTDKIQNVLDELESFDEKLATVRRECEDAATEASNAQDNVERMRETLEELIGTVRDALESNNDSERRDNIRARFAKLQGMANEMVSATTEALEYIDSDTEAQS